MRASNRKNSAYSLVEVIVATAVLLVGVIGIVRLFPTSLRASTDAALRGRASLLAQQKLEEFRRDSDRMQVLADTVETLTAPTDLVPFAEDDRLAYQFHSESVLDDTPNPNNPESAPGVPRIIVRFNPEYRASSEVIFELRFDGV